MATIRKAFLLALSILIVFSSCSVCGRPVLADVVVDTITAAPVTSGSIAAFSITMHVQQDVPANAGNCVYVRFPAVFDVPGVIDPSSILLKGVFHPVKVTVEQDTDGTTVGFDITGSVGYPSLLKWEPVRISILETAGVRLPLLSGVYSLSVWTTVEPTPVRCNLPVQQSGGNGQSVTGLTVQLSSSSAAGKAATYDFVFLTTGAGSLMWAKNDFIDIIFPDGTGFPSTLDPASILIRYQNCTNVQLDGNHLRAWVPSAVGFVAGGTSCSMTILPRAGITLPETAGNYALQVATSRDTSFVLSNQYTVTGTTVIAPIATVTPTQQGAATAVEATFTTSAVGGLLYGTDRIYVQFPAEATLPSSVADDVIKVAGRAIRGVRFGPNRRLEIPVPVDIAPMAQVSIVIPVDAGIRNPAVTGVYTINLATSVDTNPAPVLVTITPSQIGRPSIAVSDYGAGAAAVYTITFATGTGGILQAGIDRIFMRFSSTGMTMPAVMLAASITVNGEAVQTDPVVTGSIVTIVTPVAVTAGGQVSIVLGTGAGLHNPGTGGSVVVGVSTTRETAWVESLPVEITDLPVIQATVTPAEPDGQNQWYRTPPSVTFQAKSSVDTSPSVYYQLDGGSFIRWPGQAVSIPDGMHLLTCYALDHHGQQSLRKSMTIAVDTVPPLLFVGSPQDGSTVASATDIQVRGATDPGAAVTVNGTPATVDAAGGFSAVAAADDRSRLEIEAVDPAGNVTQSTVTLVVDTTPPALTVTSPSPFQSVYTKLLVVNGTTDAGAAVTINGAPVAVQADGRFTGTIAQLVEGTNLVTVAARDAVGNTTTRTLTVTYSANRLIRMKIGSVSALAGSDTLKLPVAPVIRNGTTFVPLRFVSEAFGASVQWDSTFQLIDISLGGRTIRLQIGNKTAVVNGSNKAISLPPFLQEGTTMVPIRFVSEILGARVVWDAATKTVSIFFPGG